MLIDTRENEISHITKHFSSDKIRFQNKKLDTGDYSFCVECDGKQYSYEKKITIERKVGHKELINNFGMNRDRFIREIERAKENNAEFHLLIEKSPVAFYCNCCACPQIHRNNQNKCDCGQEIKYDSFLFEDFYSTMYSDMLYYDTNQKSDKKHFSRESFKGTFYSFVSKYNITVHVVPKQISGMVINDILNYYLRGRILAKRKQEAKK